MIDRLFLLNGQKIKYFGAIHFSTSPPMKNKSINYLRIKNHGTNYCYKNPYNLKCKIFLTLSLA